MKKTTFPLVVLFSTLSLVSAASYAGATAKIPVKLTNQTQKQGLSYLAHDSNHMGSLTEQGVQDKQQFTESDSTSDLCGFSSKTKNYSVDVTDATNKTICTIKVKLVYCDSFGSAELLSSSKSSTQNVSTKVGDDRCSSTWDTGANGASGPLKITVKTNQ